MLLVLPDQHKYSNEYLNTKQPVDRAVPSTRNALYFELKYRYSKI